MARTFGALLVAVLAGLAAAGVSRLPELLAGVEIFRVAEVRVEGARYLPEARVRELAALTPDASVWDDPEPVEARLRTHPLVRDVRVRRKLPSTLVVEIVEPDPVALVPTPVLEPVDGGGRVLPIDPAEHRLDLPLLQVGRRAVPRNPMGARLAGSLPVRTMAGELARLAAAEPDFVSMVSELAWEERGDLRARWGETGVVLRFRPPLAPHRVREALTVLADATARRPGDRVATVDLRYADQVVVRYR